MEGGSLRIPTDPYYVLSEDVALMYHVRVDNTDVHKYLSIAHRSSNDPSVFSLRTVSQGWCGE